MRKVIFASMIGTVLLLSATAQAHWGPGDECGRPSEPTNEHCYSVSAISATNLGTIIQVEDEGSDVFDWTEGGFETQEEWVSWPHKYGGNAWVEVGQIIGRYANCCTPHPFQFEQTPSGVDHSWFPETVPNPGYANYLLYDTEERGPWDFYWGSPGGTNSKGQPNPVEGWYLEGNQWGGWPLRYEEAESGTEIASEDQPGDTGRDAVARWVNGSSLWFAWNGATWNELTVFCRADNQYLTAEGNQEWSVGCFK